MSAEEFVLEGPPIGEIPDCSLGEFVVKRLRFLPQDKIIHVDSGSGATQSVGEFLTRGIRLSEGMKTLGLKENDVVGMICNNRLETNEIVLGTWLCAAALTPILGTLTVGEMKMTLEIVEPKFIFCKEEALSVVNQTLKLLAMPCTVILVGSKKSHDGLKIYQEVLADVDVSNYKPQPVKFPSKQLASIFFSSGTSGLPKAVGIPHKCLILQALKAERFHSFVTDLTLLHVSPYIWVTATLVLLNTIVTGLKRVMLNEPNVLSIFKAVDKYKVGTTFLSPSMVLALCMHPEFDKYDMSSLKIISLGGSAYTPNMGEKFKQKFKDVKFVQSYGATEVAGTITSFHGVTDPYSVGKLSPGIKLKIIDVTTGKSLRANNVGEILAKSEEMMVGYLKNEKATKEAVDEDGWFHTGDLGYYDDSGQIYLLDRMKELIKIMNMQVSPVEVENVILSLPGVDEVCVTGVLRDGGCEEVVAMVVRKENSITEEDILTHVTKLLSEYKAPRGGIYFLDSLPKTPSGKVKRKAVRDLAQELYEAMMKG